MAAPDVVIFDADPGKGVGSLYVPDWDTTARVLVWPGLDHTAVDFDPMADVVRARVIVTDPANSGTAKATVGALRDVGVDVSAYQGVKPRGWVRDLKDNHRIVSDDKTVVVAASRDTAVNGKPPAAKATSDRRTGKKVRHEPTAARLWKATDMAPAAEVDWLAHHRLPRAAVSLLVGAEGIGKSALSVALIAAVTTGRPLAWFGLPARDPSDVLLVITEDDWATAVRPRLEAAGADLSRVTILCEDNDGSGPPAFPGDEHKVAEVDPPPSLIVVDAWLDTVPGGLSVKDPQQAREALAPWKEIATKTRAACILLTHTNRVATGNVRDTYGATAELRKKARMTLYAIQDDDGHLVVGPEKSNLCQTENATVLERYDAGDDIVRLRHVRDSDHKIGEYVVEAASTGAKGGRSEAAAWLHDYLEAHGPTGRKDVLAAGKQEGYSDRTLTRSLKSAGVVATLSGFPATATWSLGGRILDIPAAASTDGQGEG